MSAIAFDIRYTRKLMNKRNHTLIEQLKNKNAQIAVMGLCDQGMDIALNLKLQYNTLAFSHDNIKTRYLQQEYQMTENIAFTSIPEALKDIKLFIFPICKSNSEEDTMALFKSIIPYLKNSIVLFEATSPEFIQEMCMPYLETASGLRLNRDFSVGYSPINKNRNETQVYTEVRKVVAASSSSALNTIYDIFNGFIKAGVHKAPSIKDALTFSKLLSTSSNFAIS